MALDLGLAAEGVERGGRDDAGGAADLFHGLDVLDDALGLGVDNADQERDAAVDDAHGFALDLGAALGRSRRRPHRWSRTRTGRRGLPRSGG